MDWAAQDGAQRYAGWGMRRHTEQAALEEEKKKILGRSSAWTRHTKWIRLGERGERWAAKSKYYNITSCWL